MKMVAELESQATYHKSFKYPIFLMAEILSHILKSVPGGLTPPAQNHMETTPVQDPRNSFLPGLYSLPIFQK